MPINLKSDNPSIIGIENTSWNNIGDAFYANVAEVILKSFVGTSKVTCLESPHKRSFRAFSNVNNVEYYEAGLSQACDFLIICGPILNHFEPFYTELLKRLKERKIPYAIMSTHGTVDKMKTSIDCIRQYPPRLITTRDQSTFTVLTEALPKSIPILNSLCLAYYTSRCLPSLSLDENSPILSSSLYKKLPPDYGKIDSERLIVDSDYRSGMIDSFKLNRQPLTIGRLKHRFFSKINDHTSDGCKVIHTVHDTSYKINDLSYANKPAFFSRRPEGYLSIYKSSKLVVSDRVHATIATLSHGVPSIYCSSSFRDGAITNCGVTQSNKGLYTCNQDLIDLKYNELKTFLMNNL
ncbi:polysaccharide pyruvyl transferase family protein [bacterium]|nr:polysaccharide pyruvyl transferase family protein [bacterium]